MGADAARLRPRGAGALLRVHATTHPGRGGPLAAALLASRRVPAQRGAGHHRPGRRPGADAGGGGAGIARGDRNRPGPPRGCAPPARRRLPHAVVRPLRGGRRGARSPSVKIGRLFPDLLATLGRAASPEAGFARTLRQLVTLSGATCGGLVFRPRRGASLTVTAGARRGSALDRWLRERLTEPARGVRREAVADLPPGWRAGKPVLVRAPLGEPGSPLGQFVLLGTGGRRGLAADAIPSGFPREFGRAMEQVWRLHQRTLRLEVINEVTALSARTVSPEHIYDTVAEAVGRLVRFDALSVSLFDRERDEMRVLDMAARAGLPEGGDLRLAPTDTLAAWVAEHRMPRRVDDLSDPSIPPV